MLDTKQWGAWRQVFTDDFVSDTSGAGGKVVNGGDEFVVFVRQQHDPQDSRGHPQWPQTKLERDLQSALKEEDERARRGRV